MMQKIPKQTVEKLNGYHGNIVLFVIHGIEGR